MDKSITNNTIAFDVKEEVEGPSCGYIQVTAHMILEVKLDAVFI